MSKSEKSYAHYKHTVKYSDIW